MSTNVTIQNNHVTNSYISLFLFTLKPLKRIKAIIIIKNWIIG